jgi:hypothetical protein
MNRQVLYAKLQTGAYVVGAGDLGSTFPSQNKTLEDFNMSTDGLLLYIRFKYPKGSSKLHELAVPLANVIVMELDPETSTSISATVSKIAA